MSEQNTAEAIRIISLTAASLLCVLLALLAAGLVRRGAAVLLALIERALGQGVTLRLVGAAGETLRLGIGGALLAVDLARIGWGRAADPRLAGGADVVRGFAADVGALASLEAMTLDPRGAGVAGLFAGRRRVAVHRDAAAELVECLRLAIVRRTARGDAPAEVGARVQLAERRA